MPSETEYSTNREQFLAKEQTRVKDALKHMLYRGITIDVPSLAYSFAQHTTTSLPANTTIIDLATEYHNKLLLLGALGAGKTTMLLQLARVLLQRAKDDDTQPIPVMYAVSNWATFIDKQPTKHATLVDWLCAELTESYKVPRTIAHEWLAQHRVLPLLDGLETLTAPYCVSCVEAINEYYKTVGRQSGLVVCCRWADYQTLPVKVAMHHAIVVQPLAKHHIDDYVQQVANTGYSVVVLHELFCQDPHMYTLADTPRMLTAMVKSYINVCLQKETPYDVEPSEWQHKQLFDSYKQFLAGERSKYALPRCRVQCAPGYIVDINNKEQFKINRDYIVQHLPKTHALMAQMRWGLGFDSPLSYVSRHTHCTIYARDNRMWCVQIQKKVLIDGKTYTNEIIDILETKTLVLGGSKGWNITVYIERD